MPRDDTPSILSLRDYARFVAGEMYPGQGGVGDQRDAARHLLASGTLARKYSPEVAAVLGRLHEITNAPIDSLLAGLGMAPDPADRRMDDHNNRVGAALADCTSSQSGLEDVINREAEMATTRATPMRAMLSKYAKGGIVHDVTKAKIIPEREGPNLLTREYPKLSGFLQGVLGMAPDEVGTGSVLDEDTSENRKLQQLGAKYGFPIGTLAQMLPFGGGVVKAPGVAAGSRTAQRGVIKAPGGNWLSGSIQDAVKGLKRGSGNEAYDRLPAHIQREVDSETGLEAIAKKFPKEWAAAQDPMDQWIDSKLSKYIRDEMASPVDPIRLAADAWPAKKAKMLAEAQAKIDEQAARTARIARERGQPEHTLVEERQRMIPLEKAKALIEVRDGLHYAATPSSYNSALPRAAAGFPLDGVGVSKEAKAWESMSDSSVYSPRAGELTYHKGLLERDPWLIKVPPDTPAHQIVGRVNEELGFDHLIDELRNSLNPESGLPKELLWKYEDLAKKTVPDAVEQVSKVNAYRAAQKAEADLARANNAATVLHKEYPEAGLKWVELKKGELPEGWSEEFVETDLGKLRKFRDPKTGGLTATDPAEETLRDALKYEGDQMSHCVGGYCPDVLEGRSRIFSLRDAKGKPHVTIETTHPVIEPRLNGDVEIPGRIKQIKSYSNKAPLAEHLPYVQDFVRSGKWSDVGDLHNSGLVDLQGMRDVPEHLKAGSRFLTQQEYDDAVRKHFNLNEAPEFANGGLVQQYNPAAIDARAAQLLEELEF
jgi:hypothetical protein